MAEVSQIGPYSIISKIASGGMGTVYHARHDHMHRDVALKVMHPSFGDDSDFVMLFKNDKGEYKISAWTMIPEHPVILDIKLHEVRNLMG